VLAVAAIPTALTVLNAFSDIDRGFGWKVFFHAWFAVILVAIAASGFDAGTAGSFFTGPNDVAAQSPVRMLVSGAAWLYMLANAWFVLALAPFPLQRGQTIAERVQEVRRQMALLAEGYVWEKDDPVRSLAVMVALRSRAGPRGTIGCSSDSRSR
jgi:hypothetical protein